MATLQAEWWEFDQQLAGAVGRMMYDIRAHLDEHQYIRRWALTFQPAANYFAAHASGIRVDDARMAVIDMTLSTQFPAGTRPSPLVDALPATLNVQATCYIVPRGAHDAGSTIYAVPSISSGVVTETLATDIQAQGSAAINPRVFRRLLKRHLRARCRSDAELRVCNHMLKQTQVYSLTHGLTRLELGVESNAQDMYSDDGLIPMASTCPLLFPCIKIIDVPSTLIHLFAPG